jgi:hypothetical protein
LPVGAWRGWRVPPQEGEQRPQREVTGHDAGDVRLLGGERGDRDIPLDQRRAIRPEDVEVMIDECLKVARFPDSIGLDHPSLGADVVCLIGRPRGLPAENALKAVVMTISVTRTVS